MAFYDFAALLRKTTYGITVAIVSTVLLDWTLLAADRLFRHRAALPLLSGAADGGVRDPEKRALDLLPREGGLEGCLLDAVAWCREGAVAEERRLFPIEVIDGATLMECVGGGDGRDVDLERADQDPASKNDNRLESMDVDCSPSTTEREQDANNPYGSMFEIAPIDAEPSATEEERQPEIQTVDDSFRGLRRRSSFGSESLDGSVSSEIEIEGDDDELLTIEQLRFALRAQREAYHALYTELKKEKNTAKEAVRRQMMLEEQTRDDWQAMQILRELVTKKDEEKHVLEKQLEDYQHMIRLPKQEEGGETVEKLKAEEKDQSLPDSIDAALINPEKDRRDYESDSNKGESHHESDEDYESLADVLHVTMCSSRDLVGLDKIQSETAEAN